MARPRIVSDHLSIAQLEAILHSRRGKLGKLERQRAKLEKRLATLNARIVAFGGTAGGHGRGGKGTRAHNETSLPDSIAQVLAGKAAGMKVAAIVDAVQVAGYKTTSDNFRSIVNQALIKDKRFHALSRGIYAVKK